VKSKSLPSPKVLEAILKLIPLRSWPIDVEGRGNSSKIPIRLVCYSKNEALTVSIPKEKIWKATFFGNNILCWESPLKNISDQGISSFEKSREAR